MPTYDYECVKCGLTFEEFLPIDMRKEPLIRSQPHPECKVKGSSHSSGVKCDIKLRIFAPGFAYDNIGPNKPDASFNDKLKEIKNAHHGSTLNVIE
jgi:putative FmdB family regulatory protein